MTTSSQPSQSQPSDNPRTDAEALLDEHAAEIDARSPDVSERIAELVEEADSLGLPTPEPSQVDVPQPGDA